MIRKSELLRLLAAVPGDPVVVVWQNPAHTPSEGCDSDIEQIVEGYPLHAAVGTPAVLVLGMEIPAGVLLEPETVWSAK